MELVLGDIKTKKGKHEFEQKFLNHISN